MIKEKIRMIFDRMKLFYDAFKYKSLSEKQKANLKSSSDFIKLIFEREI